MGSGHALYFIGRSLSLFLTPSMGSRPSLLLLSDFDFFAIRDATSVVRGAFADFAFRFVVFLSAGIVLVFRSAVSPFVLDSRQRSLVVDFNFCSTLVLLSAPSSLLMRSGAC